MPKNEKISFGWKIYLVLFAMMNLGALINLVSTESIIHRYYFILKTFEPEYIRWYHLNLFNLIINIVCLLPLFLFVFQKSFLPRWVWQILLFVRLASEIFGHHYEMAFLKSLSFSNQGLLGLCVFISVAVILPSYSGHLIYSFQREITSK